MNNRDAKEVEKIFNSIKEVEKIEHIFKYHAPKEGQTDKYEEIRNKAKEFSLLISELCPVSREKSLAQTNIETSVMWANASIARN